MGCIFIFIIATSYTYYRTLCQEYSLKNRGKLDDRNKIRRRKERSIRVSVYNFLHSSTKFRLGGGGLVLEKRDLKRESHATQHLYTIIHSPLPTGYSLDLDLRQSQSPIESRTHVLL